MFIQIMQGRCSRPDELRGVLDDWVTTLGPTAGGWLGGTYGFTDDGLFVGVVRFESRELAMSNSDRPEQGEWAERFMALFDEPVEFHDSDDVTVMMDGGSDDAGFVQVIQGRVADPSGLKALMTDTAMLHDMRPEIIGATLAVEEDGSFTETVAFTSEDAARQGEGTEPDQIPAEVRATLEEAMQGARFHDLRRPWFESA